MVSTLMVLVVIVLAIVIASVGLTKSYIRQKFIKSGNGEWRCCPVTGILRFVITLPDKKNNEHSTREISF